MAGTPGPGVSGMPGPRASAAQWKPRASHRRLPRTSPGPGAPSITTRDGRAVIGADHRRHGLDVRTDGFVDDRAEERLSLGRRHLLRVVQQRAVEQVHVGPGILAVDAHPEAVGDDRAASEAGGPTPAAEAARKT